jgi:hypothetical protein
LPGIPFINTRRERLFASRTADYFAEQVLLQTKLPRAGRTLNSDWHVVNLPVICENTTARHTALGLRRSQQRVKGTVK